MLAGGGAVVRAASGVLVVGLAEAVEDEAVEGEAIEEDVLLLLELEVSDDDGLEAVTTISSAFEDGDGAAVA